MPTQAEIDRGTPNEKSPNELANEQTLARKMLAVRSASSAGATKAEFMETMTGNNPHQVQRGEAELIYETIQAAREIAQEVAGASVIQLASMEAERDATQLLLEDAQAQIDGYVLRHGRIITWLQDNGVTGWEDEYSA